MKKKNNDYNIFLNKDIALVMDGFINGYGIVRSLKKNNSIFIVVLCKKGAALSKSNLINACLTYETENELNNILVEVNSTAKSVVPYYCSDANLKIVLDLKSKLSRFYIHNLDEAILTKEHQLNIAEKVSIDIPQSWIIRTSSDIDNLIDPAETYIVKPTEAAANNQSLFKAKISNDKNTLLKYINKCIDANVPALLSIYIPGDDTSLYTFGGYAFNGELITPFAGKKISQRPRYNGVASMAESIEDNLLIEIGSRFIKEIAFTGIFQIEFKVVLEKNKYYFIEFNPRNWSWGYVATVNGKNLPLSKFQNETLLLKNKSFKKTELPKGKSNFYFWAEGIIYNLVIDKWFGIIPIALKKLMQNKVTFAFFNLKDPKPYFRYLTNLLLYALKLRKGLR